MSPSNEVSERQPVQCRLLFFTTQACSLQQGGQDAPNDWCGAQSSLRSITSLPSMLSLVRLRLFDSDTKVTSPSSSSSLRSVAERLRARCSRLNSCLISTAGCLARKRRTCSRSSSGVSSSGSRSMSGIGEGVRSMIPSTSKSPDIGQLRF
jgi:hypothetical protein